MLEYLPQPPAPCSESSRSPVSYQLSLSWCLGTRGSQVAQETYVTATGLHLYWQLAEELFRCQNNPSWRTSEWMAWSSQVPKHPWRTWVQPCDGWEQSRTPWRDTAQHFSGISGSGWGAPRISNLPLAVGTKVRRSWRSTGFPDYPTSSEVK